MGNCGLCGQARTENSIKVLASRSLAPADRRGKKRKRSECDTGDGSPKACRAVCARPTCPKPGTASFYICSLCHYFANTEEDVFRHIARYHPEQEAEGEGEGAEKKEEEDGGRVDQDKPSETLIQGCGHSILCLVNCFRDRIANATACHHESAETLSQSFYTFVHNGGYPKSVLRNLLFARYRIKHALGTA